MRTIAHIALNNIRLLFFPRESLMSENIVSLTPENFQQVVLEESKSKLVLVDFWADQIPESIALRDKLSAVLAPHAELITLALVDCVTQQAIAQQFGIQGLPTAVLVKEGQPIDGISGPQTDETLAEFLNKYLPKEEDILFNQAKTHLEHGDIQKAFTAIEQAYAIDNERADIKLVLADLYFQFNKTEQCEALLETIKMVDQDNHYQAIKAKLELAKEASNSPEIQALEQQIEQDPDNVDLSRQLALQYQQVNRISDAASLLYRLLLKDRNDADSKKLLLDILATLPSNDALTISYRRKLFSLMY